MKIAFSIDLLEFVCITKPKDIQSLHSQTLTHFQRTKARSNTTIIMKAVKIASTIIICGPRDTGLTKFDISPAAGRWTGMLSKGLTDVVDDIGSRDS